MLSIPTSFAPGAPFLIYSSPWTRPLLIPSYFALASVVVLILQALFSSRPAKRLWLRARIGAALEDESEGAAAAESSVVAAGGNSDGTRTGLVSAVKDHVERSGGSTIFLFQLARLIVVFALLALSIFCFLREEEEPQQQQPSSINSASLLRVDSLHGASKHGRKKPKHKHGHGGGSFSEREWIDLAFCLDYVRRVSSLSADLSCSLALCTGIAIRVLFGVGRDHGAENPRLGRVFPSLLAVARHLLRLRVPRCLAIAHFYAGAGRWLGRCLALGQDRPPCCCGYRHPVDYPTSICPTRSQGEILFLASSSRLSLTPSAVPSDGY